MSQLSPTQAIWRGRIETGLRFAAPVLDLVLFAGDKISTVAEPPEPRDLESGSPRGRQDARAIEDGR